MNRKSQPDGGQLVVSVEPSCNTCMLSRVWRHHHCDQPLLRTRKLDSLIIVLSLADTAY
jgi:hypothetical protein